MRSVFLPLILTLFQNVITMSTVLLNYKGYGHKGILSFLFQNRGTSVFGDDA
jgi:hypothetical protein